MMWGNRSVSDESLIPAAEPIEYLSYADLDFSPPEIEARKRRDQLVKTLGQLPNIASQFGWCQSVKSFSLHQAAVFISNLPTNRMLPKVAADDEGDILLLWDKAVGAIGLTVEGYHLHLSINPGADSTHIGPVLFSGPNIPPEILAEIPTRD
jgi:hypothetical protein